MAASAGYSGTPLAQKLGIRAGDRVALIDEPDGFRALLQPLPDAVDFRTTVRGRCDGVVAFFARRAPFARRLDALGRAVFPDGGVWIAWPKRAARVATDMTEDVVREVALPRGLVDVKVCAIDATWSGLRLVWRKERR
ncbi:MAG: DUF3052 domain-containing protein [Acidimicrobiia bacterium]|nr:DUF3052 domain-containing protein [Acidimicrobiia bacterium]MDH5238192.1 DUF3052 domain-containing protein [Acidimicrobiia bacterium]